MSAPTQTRLPAAERRAAIVAAALQVFGAGSYARATTAEIAHTLATYPCTLARSAIE